ncbi:hypothetical protein [Flavobacterium jumunjinense]|uniref:hypothetical protein n=1 Tax=Flavobacterium jumunjinense TaxID=998845 RepID=UPI001F1DD67F|nr:hypothetical protein [Flavobacterium jumunjinense]
MRLFNFQKPEAIPSANYTIGEHSVSNFVLPLYGIGLNYFVQNDSFLNQNLITILLMKLL